MTSIYPPHRAHTRIMKLTAAGVAFPRDLTDEDWLLSIAASRGVCVAFEDGAFHCDGYSATTRGQLVEKLLGEVVS